MSDANHDRFDELKEAYVLNALPEYERREFEEYLAQHPERRAELDELGAIAGLLALSPAEQDPSPELRRNLMAVVEEEARRIRAASPPANRRSVLAGLAGLFKMRNLAFGAAAMLLVGLLSWNVLLRSEVQDLQARVSQDAARQTVQGPTMVELKGSAKMKDARVELVRLEGGKAVLVAENLPPIGEEKTFQIWVIEDDRPIPGGLFRPDDEMVTVPVQSTLEGADTVAITVEPAGGSPAPTSDPMLAAKL